MHSMTRAARAIAPRPLMHANASPRSARSRGAFTLIEMLVSLTITLIMMGAVVSLFQIMAESVSGSRAALEMSDRLRGCRNRIQLDLQGATATMNPPLRPENDEGYFELIEGPFYDSIAPNTSNPPYLFNGFDGTSSASTLFGDTDDALLFTVRSRGEPFVGKYGANTLESQVAEVAYFLKQSGTEPILDATAATPIRLFTLYRRVMLVVPNLGTLPGSLPSFYDANDISVHAEGTTPVVLVANTLGDLTKPENRFARIPPGTTFPYRFNTTQTGFIGTRLGDDVLMTNVLAFDVQVWDPGAPVYVTTTTPVVSNEPRDAGYKTGTLTAFGAYADLGYDQTYVPLTGNPIALFNGLPSTKSGYTAITPRLPFVYDTWSLHYENDGLPQPSTATTFDLGTNGLDDGGIAGIVDDIGEYDTLPPYSAPLRGVRVVVRAYEPSSQQVRQVTIIQDFMPE